MPATKRTIAAWIYLMGDSAWQHAIEQYAIGNRARLAQILRSHKPIPTEVRPTLAAIVEGTLKSDARGQSRRKASVSEIAEVVRQFKVWEEVYQGLIKNSKGIARRAEKLRIEPSELIKMIEADYQSAKEAEATKLGLRSRYLEDLAKPGAATRRKRTRPSRAQ